MLAAGPELRITGAAAQTRMVSVARIRLDSRKSTRLFKGIICDDISEFESLASAQLKSVSNRVIHGRLINVSCAINVSAAGTVLITPCPCVPQSGA